MLLFLPDYRDTNFDFQRPFAWAGADTFQAADTIAADGFGGVAVFALDGVEGLVDGVCDLGLVEGC